MHNKDSNPRKTANEKHMEALDADYRASRTLMDEIMDASLSDTAFFTSTRIDFGPIEEMDFGPIEDIDFASMPALDLNEISYDEATATLASPAGNASAADLGGGKLPPGNPPSVAAADPCDPGPSKHISIRMPVDVLAAFRREAARLGMRYQRLMIDTLIFAAVQWRRDRSAPAA